MFTKQNASKSSGRAHYENIQPDFPIVSKQMHFNSDYLVSYFRDTLSIY